MWRERGGRRREGPERGASGGDGEAASRTPKDPGATFDVFSPLPRAHSSRARVPASVSGAASSFAACRRREGQGADTKCGGRQQQRDEAHASHRCGDAFSVLTCTMLRSEAAAPNLL